MLLLLLALSIFSLWAYDGWEEGNRGGEHTTRCLTVKPYQNHTADQNASCKTLKCAWQQQCRGFLGFASECLVATPRHGTDLLFSSHVPNSSFLSTLYCSSYTGIYFDGGSDTAWGRTFAWWQHEVKEMVVDAAKMFLSEYNGEGSRHCERGVFSSQYNSEGGPLTFGIQMSVTFGSRPVLNSCERSTRWTRRHLLVGLHFSFPV